MRVSHTTTDTHVGRGRRPAAVLLATAVAATATGALLLGHPGTAAADPIEQCTATTGAIVAVDFSPWGGGVVRGCDAHPTTGMNLLHNAGFTTTGTVHDGPGFICRIGTDTFSTGTQYPTPATEPCTTTPQATAYWSYWIAAPGATGWTYSAYGAMTQQPKPGEVEAWVYGATDLGGAGGGPRFTPDEVRAKNSATPSPSPSGSNSPSSSPSSSPSPSPSGSATSNPPARTGDPAAAAAWLAAQLVDGDHMENWWSEGPDYPRTALTALSLAGSGTQDAALRRVAAFLAAHTDAFVYPKGAAAAPEAQAAAMLALVAEATGDDPRAFGGRDLIAALTDHVCDSAGQGGRCTAAGDFQGASNPWNQALGVLALARAGVVPAPAVLDRFARIQCTDGGFAGTMITPGQYCESDPLTTAMAVIALQRAGGQQELVTKGVDWLVRAQQADGSFLPYAGGTADVFSTGAAAQGLRAAGRTAEADRATAWVAARQNADGGVGPDEWTPDSEAPATEQAILAFTGTDPATVLRRLNTPQPTRTPDLAKAGAFLTDRSRLLDGHYYEAFPDSGWADFGLTIDTAYALAATGTDDAALRRITDFVERGADGTGRGVNDWTMIGTEWAGGGSVGKEALLAEITGRDPRDFGGHDLIAALDRLICDHTDVAAGCAAPGNYLSAQSVFSQSLGVIAQVRAGDAERAAPAIAFLRSLQRPDGSWPSLIPASADPDVDSTAMAAMALDLLPGADNAPAVDRAVAWLAAQQKADGGFPGTAGDSVNSAGLAIQGLSLREGTYARQIARATEFLAGQQNPDGGFAVAADLDDRRSDVRASAQALSGVTGLSFATLSRKLDGGTAPEPSGSPSPSPSASHEASPSAAPSSGLPSPAPTTTLPSGTTVVDTATGGSGPGRLAFTGTDALELVVPAVLLTAAGGAVLVAVRRRTKTGGGAR
ncbi:prenyltransferase/squalene oxidase repeat-containing protein [Kitasatospora sp. NPDC092948]|uniref:prenyltransferase/squalene oxidase repeat-containing protein n=1 Tax=Kitasatospora sp. NPDC092948 TaxID=3364088 RepID=UPI00382F5068